MPILQLTPFFLPLPAESGAFLAGDAFFAGVEIFLPEVTGFGAEAVLGFFGFISSGETSLPPFLFFNSSGWMLGRTPPEAIVTPFSNWWENRIVSVVILTHSPFVVQSPKMNYSLIYLIQSGRRSDLMVSALVPGASGPGLNPGPGHCVVFLGKNT